MQDFITSLGKGFQELFRYAYPGFLFLVLVKLLEITIPVFTIRIPLSWYEFWSLIVFALIASLIIYNFHRFFIYEYILLFLFAGGIHAAGYRCNLEGKLPTNWHTLGLILSFVFLISSIYLFIIHSKSPSYFCLTLLLALVCIGIHFPYVIWYTCKSNYLYYEKTFVKKRFSKVTKCKDKQSSSENGFSNYMLNRWASAHAIGMTFWLPVLMYWYASGFPSRNGIIFKHQSIFWVAIGIFFIAWVWQVITLSIIEREFWDS